ncbi:MAG TPA: DUF3618 domain-containing protein [Jatrophihabitans sp.]|nr:DUF3618 domain-containing protein [Jatrophihabitans sp.]
MTDPDAIRAEIVATRAELVETANALAAKLDPKAQAKHALHNVHDATPEPVQHALDRAGQLAQPVVAQVKQDPKRAALVVAGAIAALIVARRLLHRTG